MNKNIVIFFVVVAVALLGIWWWQRTQEPATPAANNQQETLDTTQAIDQSLESLDMGNLEEDFQAIDQDVNSL